MDFQAFQQILADNPGRLILFRFPDGGFIPAHFHITEVGCVRKDFIDCGGTVRSTASCLLQAWVADDVEHRLEAVKLSRILELAAPLISSPTLPVEVEYEDGFISQFPIEQAEITANAVVFDLNLKHTDCLAKESCGLGDSQHSESCCSTPGCC